MMKNITPIIWSAAMVLMGTTCMAQSNPLNKGAAHRSRAGMHTVMHPGHSRGTAPANDECATPLALPLTTDCSSPLSGDNTSATESEGGAGCDNATSAGIFADVWYTFNSGANTSVEITLTPGTMTDWVLVVLDGCGGSELACQIQPAGIVPITVTANTDYIVRVYSNTEFGDPGTFTLCATAGAAAPPNDACSSVTSQNLAAGGTLNFTGTTAGATADGDFAQTDLGLSPAVWHAFTLTDACADVTINFCGTDPAFTDFYIVISPDCPLDTATAIFNTSNNTTECSDGNATLHYYGLAAGTYYIPVLSNAGTAYGPYAMTVSAVSCAPPPANNDCANAIVLTASADCVPVTGTTLLATESMPADSCAGFLGTADDDVWYMFTATAADMTISMQGDGDFDGVVELFDGTCGAFNEIDCSDATVGGGIEEIQHSGFTVGQTYYVRLFDWNSGAPATSTFSICVTEGLGGGIGFNEHDAPIAWSVFPNPSNGELNIAYGDTPGRATIEVIDMAGRTIHSEMMNMTNGSRGAVNLRDRLATGTYTVRITTAAGSNCQRVVVR